MDYLFRGTCPWCRTKAVSFTPMNMLRWQESDGTVATSYTDVFAMCGACDRGSIAVFQGHHSSHDTLRNAALECIYPAPPSEDAPPFTPDRCRRFFRQGMSSLHTGNPDAAGAMFRKALEAGLKEKFLSNKRNLIDQIKEAADSGLLTQDMADWANHIRVSGNEAAHGDDYTMKQAKALQVFTELVLIYLFELPGRLSEEQQKTANQNSGG